MAVTMVMAILLAAAGQAQPPAQLRCGDFLGEQGRKPAYLLYKGCEQQHDRQDQPFLARYEVAGKHARQAEAYLHRAYGLPALKRYCCAWDSSRHSWRDRRTGFQYVMVMATEETPVRQRQDWPAIDRFYISVHAYAHDP